MQDICSIHDLHSNNKMSGWAWPIYFHDSPHCKKILKIGNRKLHSQKQSAHWAVDVTAQMVPCWLGSWLNCNFWLVLRQRTQLVFQFIQLDITCAHCLFSADSCNTQLSGQKISWVTCIRTPESSLHLISPLNCISTETWLRWWYTVGWAVSSESVWSVCGKKPCWLFPKNLTAEGNPCCMVWMLGKCTPLPSSPRQFLTMF